MKKLLVKLLKLLKYRERYLKYREIIYELDVSSYKRFDTLDEVSEWGEEHYGEWGKIYKRSMDKAKTILKNPYVEAPIENYCGDVYREINQYLRFGMDNDLHQYRELVDTLIILLVGAPKVTEDLVVYRLVCDKFIEELIRANKRGTPVQEKGFLSTSLLPGIVTLEEHYSRETNLLKIYVKKDCIGIYVNCVTERSEQELLLLPNGYLGLLRYPYYDKNLSKMVWECVLL